MFSFDPLTPFQNTEPYQSNPIYSNVFVPTAFPLHVLMPLVSTIVITYLHQSQNILHAEHLHVFALDDYCSLF